MGAPAASVPEAKARLRRRLLAARDDIGEGGRAAQSQSIVAALLGWAPICDLPPGSVVAVYVGVGTEPSTHELLATLVALRLHVLLPIWRRRTAALDWAPYSGPADLAPTRAGLLEPRGAPLGPEAIGRAGVIVVPALAVDRAGNRLGRGAGAYDVSLRLAAPTARSCALLFTGELLGEIPAEPHDQRVSAVALPKGMVDVGRFDAPGERQGGEDPERLDTGGQRDG